MAIIGHVLGPGLLLAGDLGHICVGFKEKTRQQPHDWAQSCRAQGGRMGMIELYSALLSIGTTTTLTLLHRTQDTVDGQLFLTDEINVYCILV